MKNKWDRGTHFLGRSNCARAMSVECTPCNWRDFQTFSYKLLYFSTWEVLSFFFQRMLMFTFWAYGSWAKEVDSKSPQFSTSFEFALRGQQICEFQEIPCLSQCASLALWMMAIKSSQGELIEIDWATRACSCRSIPPSPSSRCIVHSAHSCTTILHATCHISSKKGGLLNNFVPINIFP